MATGAAEFIDATTAAAMIPELWSKEVQIARDPEMVFAELVDRHYEKQLSYGDTLHVTPIGSLTVQTKVSADNAAVVFETETPSNIDIVVNTWQYAAVALQTIEKKQSHLDLMGIYAPRMGVALALAFDDSIAALVDDFTQVVGTLAMENTYDDFVLADQYLNDANAPVDGRAIVVSPAAKAGMMKLDQFIHGDYSKLNSGVSASLKAKNLGTWMGYPVYMSTNVEGSNASGHDNGMFHKSAIAAVLQMDPTSHTDFDINYLAFKAVTEQLSGVKEMRDDHGVYVRGA
jgi:hypothetical protein